MEATALVDLANIFVQLDIMDLVLTFVDTLRRIMTHFCFVKRNLGNNKRKIGVSKRIMIHKFINECLRVSEKVESKKFTHSVREKASRV